MKLNFTLSNKYLFLFLSNFLLMLIFKNFYIIALSLFFVLLGMINYKKFLPITHILFSMLLFVNPIFGSIDYIGILWQLYILFFSLFFFIKGRLTISKLEFILYLVMLSFLVTSIIVSPLPSIAIIKTILFVLMAYVLFNTYRNCHIVNNKFIFKFFESIVLFSFVLSFTKSGYYINGLFMGIFDHSQSFGIFFIPLFVYYTIAFIDKQRSKNRNIFGAVIIFLSMYEVLLTSSRVAIFSYVIIMSLYYLRNKLNGKSLNRFLCSPVSIVVALSLVFFGVLKSQELLTMVMEVAYKDITSSGKYGDLLDTRLDLFTNSYNNFISSPFIGTGFSIQLIDNKIDYNAVSYMPLFDIPYTMLREKGGVYLAILEEGGVVTMFIFIVFFIYYLRGVVYNNMLLYSSLSIFIMFLAEGTFFTIIGAGAFQLVFLIFLYEKRRKKVDL
jgi:hypothetical protein